MRGRQKSDRESERVRKWERMGERKAKRVYNKEKKEIYNEWGRGSDRIDK